MLLSSLSLSLPSISLYVSPPLSLSLSLFLPAFALASRSTTPYTLTPPLSLSHGSVIVHVN